MTAPDGFRFLPDAPPAQMVDSGTDWRAVADNALARAEAAVQPYDPDVAADPRRDDRPPVAPPPARYAHDVRPADRPPVAPPIATDAERSRLGAEEGLVDLVSSEVRERTTTPLIDDTRRRLVGAVGGVREAESVNLWEGIRVPLARVSSRRISDILGETHDTWAHRSVDDGDALDQAVVMVVVDQRGSTDPERAMRGVDAKDLALKVSPAEVDNPTHSDTQDKAAAVIRLLSAVGSYKAERWQGTDQLRAAAETLEMWAGVPGFDPAQAGLDETRFATAKALAALEADTLTKPHYQYSHRERALFASALNEVLDHLDRAEARYLLHVATGHITV